MCSRRGKKYETQPPDATASRRPRVALAGSCTSHADGSDRWPVAMAAGLVNALLAGCRQEDLMLNARATVLIDPLGPLAEAQWVNNATSIGGVAAPLPRSRTWWLRTGVEALVADPAVSPGRSDGDDHAVAVRSARGPDDDRLPLNQRHHPRPLRPRPARQPERPRSRSPPRERRPVPC